MLSLSKKTDYALIALGYLAEQPGRVASARQITDARDLPAALLTNILKELQQHGLLRSTRGVKGGYELARNLSEVSLYDLITTMDGPIRLVECAGEPRTCVHEDASAADACRVSGHCIVQAPLQALHNRLVKFLQDVNLRDVIHPA